MKEVKEVKTLLLTDNFYLTIFELLKQGFNPAKICSKLNISKQNLNYYIRRFKNEGFLQKKGYGTWETKEVKTLLPKTLSKQVKEIRGHAFIWTIKLPQNLIDLRDKIEGITLNKGQKRIFIKNHKVWIGKKSLVIYEPKSFYAKNSIEARKYAIISLLEVVEAFENKFNVKIGKKIFKPSREHYGQIKNDLARQYNRKGEKMIIHDDLEGNWLWIDDSKGLGELETNNLVRSKQVQDWWNDKKEHNFKITDTFLLSSIAHVTENQEVFAQNLVSHVEAIKKLGNAVDELKEVVKKVVEKA